MLTADLEIYKQRAIELGAAGAEIIDASLLVIDERVRLKCIVPRCQRAGETPNCPPFLPGLDTVRRAFSRYSKALLFKTQVELNVDCGPDNGVSEDGNGALLFHRKTGEIVCEIERLACGKGHYLAMGLGGGSCKDYLCQGRPCQFLNGEGCRFPQQSRPAMEAMGIDVFDIIGKVGWDTPTFLDSPDKIHCAISVGLVFIY